MSWKSGMQKCLNCGDVMHDVCESVSTGEYVMWCDMCGTVLTANTHDPVSCTDFAVPHVVKETTLPVNRLPIGRMWK